MNDEVKLILTKLKIVSEEKENGAYICDKEHSKLLLSYIEQLENKNKENSLLLIGFQDMEQRIEQLQKKAELGEHYKHLYSEVKKQKDDVVKLIYKKMRDVDIYGTQTFELNELLRMLGEMDD